MKGKNYNVGLEIEDVTICDFSQLKPVNNEEILQKGRGKTDPRLISFITQKMGIQTRYHCPDHMTSFDLASTALDRLIEKNPDILETAEFVILAGISNPMPTVCTSSLLAGDKGFKNASCWDLKSGCSTGILALLQSLDWLNLGAERGVVICTESMSKFANPDALQMSAATGDGASAMIVKRSADWEVLGAVHGTDSAYMRSIYVPGIYPVKKDFDPMDYVFAFEEKSDALEKMAHYWQKSLTDLLEVSKITGADVTDYVAHQIDGTKNKLFAQGNGIKEDAIALNFEHFGNMGCPTVFINYKQWIEKREKDYQKGDVLVLHAVGGGLSWAGLCMRKIK